MNSTSRLFLVVAISLGDCEEAESTDVQPPE